jgi:4-hydroxyproline epimerase
VSIIANHLDRTKEDQSLMLDSTRIKVIDSHTGGEPTRTVITGGPDLGTDSLAIRRERFRSEFDHFRSSITNEPRGSDALVGALLCEPVDKSCVTGVIFFNNVGYLGMCGHGTIGIVATLSYLGRISPGQHRIETPVGVVEAVLDQTGEVTVANVPSYRLAKNVSVEVEGHGLVTGDIAWGGNWFFLVNDHGQDISFNNLETLTDFTWQIRQALNSTGITGEGGQEIDHVELFGPSTLDGINSKNFVLCPGRAYDRSPCGTGTSAKLACLVADGKLVPGQVWRQESVVGSIFEGTVEIIDGNIYPRIKGSAFITSEAELILDPRDPFCMGIRS